jgi:hypothetical protein
MGRALLGSVLARQALLLKDALAARYPNAWLVAEGRGASPATPVDTKSATRIPSPGGPTAPQGADALFLELAPAAPGTLLRLGRAAGNDLVIEDPTVSRAHLALIFENGRWHVEVPEPPKDAANAPLAAGALAVIRLPTAPKTFLRSQPLPPGQRVALTDGDTLRLGDVVCTYLEPASFLRRIGAEAAL